MTRSVLALVAAVGCLAADGEPPPLTTVRRIYVDRLSGASAAQIRDMIINALQASRMFQITENADKADAFLRGSAEDNIYSDLYQSSEGVHAGASFGSGAGSRSVIPRVSTNISDQESSRTVERKHEATAAVRLVDRDGDVIWSTTQESAGAKFRGAAADVSDKVVRQLLADLDRARHPQAERPAMRMPSLTR